MSMNWRERGGAKDRARQKVAWVAHSMKQKQVGIFPGRSALYVLDGKVVYAGTDRDCS